MEINNVFSPVPFYANKRYWHSNKWYTYGQKCPIIMTAEKTLPFQLVVSPGVTLSSFTIKKADNDASVMTVNTAGNYFSIDAEAYSIIQVKACTIGTLPYGNYYYALTLSDGSTYVSDIIAIISDMSKCIKITYKNVENLYFSSGHIDFSNDFVFELYLPTTIGKPEYEYEEELTKRLGYKFLESQVVNKVYKFTFPATEQLCDAYRFVRMCDYIRIDTYNPDFSDYDHYNIIYLSSEVEWLDNGDIASVETSFETDSIVQKLQDYSRTQLVNFYNALLSNSDEALKFDDETIAQYYNNYLQSIDGKMIRQLNAVSSISDNTVIAIDENNGTGAANKILLKPLLINTVAEQLRASEVLANFQQHINNSSIHITVAEKAILSLFGVDDNGDVYVKGDKGFYTNSFVSAKGKSSSAGGGGSASALYQLVDVLANSTNDGVQGATTNSVLMYNGTKWYAGTIDAGLDEAALKAYLDANKYTTTTYVDSQISTINSQLDTKADKTALSTYLPLSGGTITGDLTVNDTIYVGTKNYVYHTGNLAGDNAWITLASNTIGHKTIHANNITLIASSGQFVTGYTVDKAGHVTSISQRALNASDIPNIAITKVTGLQDALDKKVDTAFFARVFGLLDADGNEIAVNDVVTVADSIKAKFGLWTEQYISAKGKNSSAGGGGSVSALYQLVDVLANSTNDGVLNATNGSVLMYNGTKWYAGTIDTGLDEAALKAYLDANKYTTTTYVDSKLDTKADKTALNAYATLTYVNDELAGTNSTVSALVEKVNNFLEGTDTDGIINKWKELEAFLAGQTQTSTLADLLNVKAFASTKIIAGTGLTGGGDLTADITLSLATSGVTAGTYPKVTVDKYGRVTAGSSLSASDIPNLSWNKITSDKPTTLSGYGITDGVNSVNVSGSGNAVTSASISGHTLTLTKGATYLLQSTFDDLFEKVLLEDGKTYAIRAKYGFYSDSFVSSKGLNSSSSGGGSVSALYQLVDVLANSTNDGVLNAANGSVLMYNGTKWQAGNVVTDISPLTLNVNGSSLFTYDGKSSITANLTVPTKVSQLTNDSGYLTAITKAQVEGVLTGNITSHTHSYLPLSGGALTGALRIDCPSSLNNDYNEGIRCNLGGEGSYASVVLGGANGSTSGSGAGVYSLVVGSRLFRIRQSSTEVIAINTSNNVGIGTTSPSYKLHSVIGDNNNYVVACFTNTSSHGGIAINSANNCNPFIRYQVNGTAKSECGYSSDVDNFYIGAPNTSIGHLNINITSGNTGIGTISPSYKLHVAGYIYTTTGFKKYGSSDSYVLLGGGGHKEESSLSVASATSSTKSGYSRSLLGRNTTGDDYGVGSNNLIFAEYSTMGDRRWYLKADGYECRVDYATNAGTSDNANNAERLYIKDLRGEVRNPNYFDGGKITAWFNNNGTPNSSWHSGIHVKGWSDGYTSWELCSYSSIETANDYDLYFRSGNNTTWGNWKTVITSSNYNSYSPTLTGTGASGTWGISITGNAATATNADMLDGKHSGEFGLFLKNANIGDLNTSRNGFRAGKLYGATNGVDNGTYRGFLEYGLDGYVAQFNSDSHNNLYYRWCEASKWLPWKQVAFTDSNVASATKLQTARTIWGQSFDGTSDVNGPIRVYYKSTDWGNWNEGIRLYGSAKDGTWSNIHFGCDPSATVGSHANQWMIGRNHLNQFGIFHGTDSSTGVIQIGTDNNVGIGINSPAYKLDVNGQIHSAFASTNGHPCIMVNLTQDIDWCYGIEVLAPNLTAGHRTGAYWAGKANSANNAICISYYHAGDGSDDNKLIWHTWGKGDRMTLTASGNVGIGTTSPLEKLYVAGNIAATGAITAKASSSDIRLKTDISDYKALSIIRSHKSIKYHWNAVAKANADVFNDDYWHYGLIAQDVQRDMPQMVSDVFKDYLVINYERLIPICWKGLQEVDDEVTKLKKKVRKLEMEIRELKQKEDRL